MDMRLPVGLIDREDGEEQLARVAVALGERVGLQNLDRKGDKAVERGDLLLNRDS